MARASLVIPIRKKKKKLLRPEDSANEPRSTACLDNLSCFLCGLLNRKVYSSIELDFAGLHFSSVGISFRISASLNYIGGVTGLRRRWLGRVKWLTSGQLAQARAKPVRGNKTHLLVCIVRPFSSFIVTLLSCAFPQPPYFSYLFLPGGAADPSACRAPTSVFYLSFDLPCLGNRMRTGRDRYNLVAISLVYARMHLEKHTDRMTEPSLEDACTIKGRAGQRTRWN